MKRFLTATAVFAVAVGAVATAEAKQPPRVPVCHSTGSASQPYTKLMLPAAVAAKHVAHHRDIIGTAGQPLQCPTTPLSARGGGQKLTASLSGAGTAATGTFSVRLNRGQGMVCYTLTQTGLVNVTAAHIHVFDASQLGAPFVNNGIVVPLAAPTTGSATGCVAAPRAIVKAIGSNPSNFYVNVHTVTAPAGAIQGTLST
jgi:hypothetical protein